jgi:hypothetical protein
VEAVTFASAASDHDRAVLEAAKGCVICGGATAFVKVGHHDLFAYCKEHGGRLQRGLVPVEEC